MRTFYRTGDYTFQTPRLDSSTHAIETIDYEHHEIHAGSHYFYTDSAQLDAAETQDYVIYAPNTTKWAHIVFSISGSAITQVQLYEETAKTGVAAQPVFNSNRNSDKAAGVKVYKGSAGEGSDGILIWQRKSGSATAQSRVGIEATRNDELILRQGRNYLFRITSGTNANLTNILLSWYEHTDKVP